MWHRILLILLAVAVLGALAGAISRPWWAGAPAERRDERPMAVPVEVVPIQRGAIEEPRTFSGTLNSRSRLTVAPKVAGRIQKLTVDLADPVRRGQVVAELDRDDAEQALAQARADLAVADANVQQARNARAIAQRELDRVRTLQQRGVASDAQLDTAESDVLSAESALAVAEAQATRAAAALARAEIQLANTRVQATWAEGGETRLVAERYADEGELVGEGTPLLLLVELDPIQAVINLPERDYGRVTLGQPVTLSTDAYPGESFAGRVARVAPVFRETSRQARVELDIPNPGGRLKPGMFVRARVVLDRAQDATIVPAAALLRRAERHHVFTVDDAGTEARMHPVRVGLRDGDRVQVIPDQGDLTGRVVVVGQQLLDDGSAVHLPAPPPAPTTRPADPAAPAAP